LLCKTKKEKNMKLTNYKVGQAIELSMVRDITVDGVITCHVSIDYDTTSSVVMGETPNQRLQFGDVKWKANRIGGFSLVLFHETAIIVAVSDIPDESGYYLRAQAVAFSDNSGVVPDASIVYRTRYEAEEASDYDLSPYKLPL
jgi:hypothetical protein